MTRNRAMLLIVTGASFMSFVGLLMRLLETTDGMLILFYRSITLTGMVGLVACLRRRQSPAAFLRSLDRTDMMMGAALMGFFATRASISVAVSSLPSALSSGLRTSYRHSRLPPSRGSNKHKGLSQVWPLGSIGVRLSHTL